MTGLGGVDSRTLEAEGQEGRALADPVVRVWVDFAGRFDRARLDQSFQDEAGRQHLVEDGLQRHPLESDRVLAVPHHQIHPLLGEIGILEVPPIRRRVGGGEREPAARAEHPEHLAQKLGPSMQVVQHQGTQHAVERCVGDSVQRGVQIVLPYLGASTEPVPRVRHQLRTALETQHGRATFDQCGRIVTRTATHVEDPLVRDVAGQLQHRGSVYVCVVRTVLGVVRKVVAERAVIGKIRGHDQQYPGSVHDWSTRPDEGETIVKIIYVITHPQATHHRDGLVGGWFDSDLTDLGRRQADAIASALSLRLDGAEADIVSSDLRRARTTAEVIAARIGRKIELDTDLREKSYGEAEGRPKAWLSERQIPIPDHGERLRHDEGIAGAETRMDLAVRAYAAMRRVQDSTARNIVMITHGGTATLLLAAWIGMPLESAGRVQFGLSSGGITQLLKNDRNYSHEIAQLNDTSHLAA